MSERPEVCVVDSVQTLHAADLTGAAGSVGQVREVADVLREAGFDVIEEGRREPARDHPVGVALARLLQWLGRRLRRNYLWIFMILALAVVVKLIDMANSPVYGLPRKIARLEEALMLLGSDAEQVLRQSPVPVLLVRGG